jgi:transposase
VSSLERRTSTRRTTCLGGYSCARLVKSCGSERRVLVQTDWPERGHQRSTVQGYVERAQQAGLSWPLPEELDDAAIEARLFTRSEEELRPDRSEPNWLEVHRDRKRGKHVTLQLLHLEYKAAHLDGLSYTQFCVHYRGWLDRQDLVMRLEYAAGERMFVDFAGDTVPVTDPQTGEVWDARVFVSVLGASGYLYAGATRGQDLASWLGAHVRALEFYGGCVRAVVPDNLKAGVTHAYWYEPELNPSYLDWARWYSVAVLPARCSERIRLSDPRQLAVLRDRSLHENVKDRLGDRAAPPLNRGEAAYACGRSSGCQ